MNKKHNIKFAVDYTNKQPVYTRNKIRLELQKKSLKEKQSIFK
jgi:tRNA(Ile)-lysidine synthase TilS/MesJ